MTQATALHRHARIAAQKVRLVADQIRGKNIESAVDILNFSNKKAAVLIKKVLDSAVANAENNEGADIDELLVHRVMIDEGPMMKRMKPRARGRSDRILKRSCHIKVTVAEK